MKKIAFAVIGVALCLSASLVYPQEEAKPLVRFSLNADKDIYEIGEEIHASGTIKNLSSKVAYLQTLRPFVNTTLAVKTPSGERFEAVDERGPFYPTDFSAVLPGEEIEYFRVKLQSLNFIKTPGEPAGAPFKEEGTYEISYTYQDADPVIKKALSGLFAAEPVNITLVSIRDISTGPKEEPAMPHIFPKKAEEEMPAEKEAVSLDKKPITQEQAVLLATKYINNQKEYKKKKMSFLFISDTAENGYWVSGFEEEGSKDFHAVKVNVKTGEAEEAYFIE